uniref:TetR/AcrR family transcriptional regulator n=1 Tax=Rhodococcus qingshengii TaxID=334542 RepID=UPI001C4E1B84|nr:TetR/AcrR family transcriptional regulator [Rhodococcus qingshengii]
MTTTNVQSGDGRLRRGRRTREQLLRAAVELFGSKGFAATSMKDLAASAGVRAPAIYNHFVSKDHVLAAALVWVLEEFRSQVLDHDDPSEPALSRLENLVRRHVHFQAEHSTMVRAADALIQSVITEKWLTPEDREEVRALLDAYREVLAVIVEDLRSQVVIDLPATTFCVPAIIALCDQAPSWQRQDDGTLGAEVADACWSLVAGMLRQT